MDQPESTKGLRVPWRVRDALLVFGLSWIILPIAILSVLAPLSQFSSEARLFLELLRSGDILASFVLVLINAVAALGLITYYLRRHQVGWYSLGFRRFSAVKAIFYIVLILLLFRVAIVAAYALVEWLWPAFDPVQEQANEFTQVTTPAARRISFLALVVLPPLVEETVFRGFMFPALAKRWGVVLGAILTSLFFGLAHLQANVGIYTLVLSLLLCMMYWRLGSLWPGIIFHMLNNYLAFIALLAK